ncbi:hypothetical protein M514_00377 [Trichuris suis]|uniref:Uncharacterized protein n=1 Tax=Trichuris suis TaxID=68888 RepID=A0A085MN88_9BILA|nr:hypothetical protein M513_00377 [Trichuris suis]KFD71963.1 hypothetical protein M514_00377 [Trichuris suis]
MPYQGKRGTELGRCCLCPNMEEKYDNFYFITNSIKLTRLPKERTEIIGLLSGATVSKNPSSSKQLLGDYYGRRKARIMVLTLR